MHAFERTAREVHGTLRCQDLLARSHDRLLLGFVSSIHHKSDRRSEVSVSLKVSQDRRQLRGMALEQGVCAVTDPEVWHLKVDCTKRKSSPDAADADENAGDTEEARRIWGALTRVVALTPETLAERPVHAGTLKLDGKRVALVRRGGVTSRVDALGRLSFDEAAAGGLDFVLDAEEHGGVFWVFDALLVAGQDLRALALADRLVALEEEHRAGRLPGALGGLPLKLKVYRSLRSPGALDVLLSEAADSCDGLIFCDVTAPYEIPAFKYKPCLTLDFSLESGSASSPPGSYRLLTQVAGVAKVFRVDGRAQEIHLDASDRVRLGLPPSGVLDRSVGFIVQFELPRSLGGRQGRGTGGRGGGFFWKAVRRRFDRRHPNCLRTVLDTLALHRRGLDSPDFLRRAFQQPFETKAAVKAWLTILRRRLWALEVVAAPDHQHAMVIEILGVNMAPSSAYQSLAEGARVVALSRLAAALPAVGRVLVVAFFSLGDQEIASLLLTLRGWLAGSVADEDQPDERGVNLVLAAQTTAGGCSRLLDARFFCVVNEVSPKQLGEDVSLALGGAHVPVDVQAPLVGGGASELLALPLLLSSLSRGLTLVRASSHAHSAEQAEARQTPSAPAL